MITFKLNDMDKFKTVFTLLVALFICNGFYVQAQDEITLMVSADGMTKGEATKSALRSAIEQAYGAFVSSNTSILNDELIKDEIVTISTGNIKSYKEISSYVSPDGNSFVTLQITVCPSKLISYAQSKGAEVEFAGATFAMNLKMKELNKRNEEIVIKNMLYEMDKLYSEGLDFTIETGEPKADGKLEATVEVIPNEYGVKAWKLFYSTLDQLSLTDKEQKEYEISGIPMYILECYGYRTIVTETDIIKEFIEREKEDVLTMGKKWSDKQANKVEKFVRKNFDIASLVEERNKALMENPSLELKRNFAFRSFETLKSINAYLSYYYVKRIFGFIIKAGNKVSTIDLISSVASYDDRYERTIKENYVSYGENIEMGKTPLIGMKSSIHSNKEQWKVIYAHCIISWARYLTDPPYEGFSGGSVGFQREYIANKELLGYIVNIPLHQSVIKNGVHTLVDKGIKNFPSFFFDEQRGQRYGVMVSYPHHIVGNAIHTIYMDMQIPVEDLMKIVKM